MKKKSIPLFLILILGAGLWSPLLSQVSQTRLAQNITTLAGLNFETWSAEDNRVRQFSLPLTVVYPVNPQFRLDLTTSPALSGLKAGTDYTLNGLSDTRIRGSYLTMNDRALVTFGVNLPTGKHALAAKEHAVATTLALHALDFKVPNYGQGLDLNLGVATAFQSGTMVLGVGAGYLLKGAYKPFKDFDLAYKPGNELTLTAGVDVPSGERRKFLFDAIYTLYGADKADKKKAFQSGNKLVLQGIAVAASEAWQWQALVRDRLKSKNKIGYESLSDERKNSNGNELELSLLGINQPAKPTHWKGTIEGKLYANNGYDTGGATIFGAGIGIEHHFTDVLLLNVMVRFYKGKLKSGPKDANLTGIKIGGMLNYTL